MSKINDFEVPDVGSMNPVQIVLSGEDFDKFTKILENDKKSFYHNKKLEKLFEGDTLFGKEFIFD